LSRIGIERQDVLGVVGKESIEPTVEEGLTQIATMADKLDAAPQFPDRYCGEVRGTFRPAASLRNCTTRRSQEVAR
jgi:hypothetical protein